MISCTINQYKESFKTNLLAFLNEYEDNTKNFFLQGEKDKYQAYQNSLTKIANQLQMFTKEELNRNLVHKSIADDLKKINLTAYNNIITEQNSCKSPEDVLSLHFEKSNTINVNEKELENHIKSSIVILKFIGEQNNIPNDVTKQTYIDELGESVLKQSRNPGLDENLDKWLKIYEANFEYLDIPMIIEEKRDYVTDSYNNYEERYFNYQIDVCNTILRKVSNEKTIIEYKTKFENNIIELRKEIPLPDLNIEKLISDINNAFFRLEKFMDGSVSTYQSFLFNDYFTLFFNELNKLENVNAKNYKLRDGYHNLLYHIDYAFDKSEFKNQEAYDNEAFCRDCNEIGYIHFYRISEFGIDTNLEDNSFRIPSILEIANDFSSEFDQNIDQVLDSKQILKNDNIANLFDDNKTNTHLYKVIIDIINHPCNILSQDENDDYLGLDEEGRVIYKDTTNRDKYDVEKDINEPFSNLESLTIELMNNTKHQKVLNGYLKLIFREFMETAVIIIDYCNEYLFDSAKKSKNYPKDLEYFFCIYKISLERYYDFIIEFLDDDFLKKENKIFIIDGGYQTTTFPKLQTEKQINIKSDDKVEKKDDLSKEQNDVLKSTIDDYLEEFKIYINSDGYDILVSSLFEYFTNGSFPVLTSKINFKRINKKRVGWALKKLYKSEKTNNLEIEYFRFAKGNINLFADEIIIEEGFKKSKFYKMFTTNPAK